MSPEQDNFDELRRLLALKRHEQPPPGYFHDFSRQVIARIKAEEAVAAESFLQRCLTRAPWLQKLWDGFEAKPFVAGAFGVGVCSLLIFGLVSSERMDSAVDGFASDNPPAQAVFARVPMQTIGSSLFENAAADHSLTGSVYTAQNRSSIFDEIQKPRVQPVSFSVHATSN